MQQLHSETAAHYLAGDAKRCIPALWRVDGRKLSSKVVVRRSGARAMDRDSVKRCGYSTHSHYIVHARLLPALIWDSRIPGWRSSFQCLAAAAALTPQRHC